jgi:hypothetical protein
MRFEIAARSATLLVVCMCFYFSIVRHRAKLSGMSLPTRLEACKGKFGLNGAREVLALLNRVERTRKN